MKIQLVWFTDWTLKQFTELPDDVQFIAWGEETCPKTKRLHNQGRAYVEKTTQACWAKRLRIVGHGLVDICTGLLEQNEDYCSKEGRYHTLGLKPMGDGKKLCLHQFTDAILRKPQL